MSDEPKTGIGRRPVIAALAGIGGLAIAGAGGYEAAKIWGTHYAPTPYDDLLNQLYDRDAAARLGARFLAAARTFDPKGAAAKLRDALSARSLRDVVRGDARQNRLEEIDGWVLPQSLAILCALDATTVQSAGTGAAGTSPRNELPK